ncbi:MAG: preprotein translocase subunit SecE [Microcoleus sp.]
MAKKDEIVAKKDETQELTESSGFDPVVFFKETREELDKVVWPSRQQLISESLAVLLMVILSASLIYLVDNFFNWGAGEVFKP